MDNFRLQIKTKQGERVLQCKAGENLMSVLNAYGYNIPASCGGNHTCGKCKVQILSGASDAKNAEKEVFTKEELDAGWRLACNVSVYNPMTINVSEETPFYIPEETPLISAHMGTEKESSKNGWQVAIDIGTTTLAFSLCRGICRSGRQ